LCYRCWEKLLANQVGIVRCPICRKLINPSDEESEGSEVSEDSEVSEN
jgi:hypothetical protein